MPVVMLLLVFLVPVVVAISADLGHFALLVVLICVVAGLARPMSETSSEPDGGDTIASARRRSVHVVSTLNAN